MKADRFTKSILLLISALLTAILLRPLLRPDLNVNAQSTLVQKSATPPKQTAVSRVLWEYKSIDLARKYLAFSLGDYNRPVEDGTKEISSDWLTRSQELGAEGWELVSVTAQSNISGQNFSGDTSEILFLFKRPKQ